MSQPSARFLASNLTPGRLYQVRLPFKDYDGGLHPAGETWRFVRKSFSPHDDGLTLFIEQAGQSKSIRLEWLPETQAAIIQNFSDYVALLPEESSAAAPLRPGPAKKGASLWVKLLAGAAIAAGLLVCLLACAFVAFEYAISYSPGQNQTRPGLDYTVNSQVNVRLNQDFVLGIKLTNNDTQPKMLYSIGLPGSFLAGVAVRGSQPPFSDFASLPGSPNYVTFTYRISIPANRSLDLTFHLLALKPGDYSGKIKLCVDSPTDCILQTTRSFIQ